MTDFATYTNTALKAVSPGTLSSDDLQLYREEMQDRGLSSIPPPSVPTTPAPSPNEVTLQSPDGGAYYLGVDADGALRTTATLDPSKTAVHVRLPAGIADGQILVYDAVSKRMVAGMLPGAKVVPGDALSDDSSANLPMTAEDGVSWMQADTLPDWLVNDVTSETLTNEAGTLALTQG